MIISPDDAVENPDLVQLVLVAPEDLALDLVSSFERLLQLARRLLAPEGHEVVAVHHDAAVLDLRIEQAGVRPPAVVLGLQQGARVLLRPVLCRVPGAVHRIMSLPTTPASPDLGSSAGSLMYVGLTAFA